MKLVSCKSARTHRTSAEPPLNTYSYGNTLTESGIGDLLGPLIKYASTVSKGIFNYFYFDAGMVQAKANIIQHVVGGER